MQIFFFGRKLVSLLLIYHFYYHLNGVVVKDNTKDIARSENGKGSGEETNLNVNGKGDYASIDLLS